MRLAARRSVPTRCVIVAGQFTPPIHGMAVATDALGALLATLGPLIRLRTVPPQTAPGGRLYHLRRALLVTRAASKISLLRSKSDAVLLSVDAGKGMLYVILLTRIARWLGYRVVLEHHSYAYISRRSRLAATLAYVGGSGTQHLYSCHLACDEFRRLYPRASRVRTLSVAYAVEPAPQRRASTDVFVSRQLRLGHLSNLSIEKGLEEVIRFGRSAIQKGIAEKVILAGPVAGRAEFALIESLAGERGFEYRGPVTGQRKEDFFRDIDVFPFPTRYRNELSPLVVWEAMLRGVPVIAYRAGCLTQTVIGSGNLVLEPGENFTAGASRLIERWSQFPEEFARACADVAAFARNEREHAISDALSLGAELFASPGQGA
jgi:glycosyltransferase involved in cell wall biosynthesis